MRLSAESFSELQFQGELNDTRAAHRGSILAESRIPDVRVGNRKIRMIEDVKELGPEGQVQFFGQRYSLRDEPVPILLPGAANLRDIAAEVSQKRAGICH